ncbi:MAG: proteinMgtE intracellular protein [Ilumatobacteraceae bacterium]|nr:proteinMgtE intracellular protein [Ilumatobacteraceae bacterium]
MAHPSKMLFPVRQRAARVTQNRRVRDQLVSVAGLIGRPVTLRDGRDVGRVVDFVVRGTDRGYPGVTGLVARVGRRRVFVPIADVAELRPTGVTMSTSHLDVRDFERRDGEVLLMGDVVDHQLVDIDGVQIVRASDLYLSGAAGPVRLVGVEVGVGTLLRRLGPARFRTRATPERVIDWADIEPLSRAGAVQIDRSRSELRRLRPGDLADLLEQVGQPQRDQLVDSLDVDLAADALEEMSEQQRDEVIRNLDTQRAALIIAEMEPDEAVEVLREIDDDRRDTIVDQMPAAAGAALRSLLGYAEGSAGGIMTTVLVLAREHETVREVTARLRSFAEHRSDIDGVLIVGADGALLDDVSLFELIAAGPERSMLSLVGPPWPIVVSADASLDEVIDATLSNRRGSIVVADDAGRPLGRILADDVLDALTPGRAGIHRDVGEQ